jgi:hypothetical protein
VPADTLHAPLGRIMAAYVYEDGRRTPAFILPAPLRAWLGDVTVMGFH